jgi:DNA-binding response OmpR family regulator
MEENEFDPPGQRQRPLILLADDDPEIRRLLTLHFSSTDCDIIETADGAETLEAVIVYKPDLVVLDVMMPELSGWEICKYIKEREDEYAHTGVLMLTAIGEINNALTSPLFGADDYMDKPFDLGELDAKVQHILANKKRA